MIIKSSWLARTIAEKLKSIVGNREELVRKTAEEVNEEFLDWLSRKGQRPFFVFLNYMDAHAPYSAPPPFDTHFGPKKPWPAKSRRSWSRQEYQVAIDAYDGTIAYVDYHLGRLLDELSKRNLLQNTVVVVTSDHGELFGEHRLFGHGNSLYRPLLHVPMVISFPSLVPAGKRIDAPITLRDLTATMVELAGLAERASFPGQSLTKYWSDKRYSDGAESLILAEVSKSIGVQEWKPIAQGDIKSLVSGGMQYMRYGDGSEELYDFDHDPAEEHNLAGDEKSRPILLGFRQSLGRLLLNK